MRHQLEIWLAVLLEKYDQLRVSYLLVLALLLIVIGSMACSTAPPEKPRNDLAAAATAGKPLYEKNCAFCHGATGASDGTFEPKPPRIDSGEVLQDTDDEIFLVIKNGKGKAMPAMKRLTDEEIRQIVAFVRTLAKK
jgi:mono/diheme cytochrome c family protein